MAGRATAAADGAAAVRTAPPRPRSALVNVGAVILVGLVITGALVVGARSVHDRNEDRLLEQRAGQVAALLSAGIPSVQATLSAAAHAAEATDGDPSLFRELAQPVVAAPRTAPTSVSLWRLDPGTAPQRIGRVGIRPLLPQRDASRLAAFFDRAAGKERFSVVDLLDTDSRRLGFAYTVPTPTARYLVYREIELAPARTSPADADPAFSDVDYALYLGGSARADKIIASSTGGRPLEGRIEAAAIDFGESKLLVTVTPKGELGGTLLAWLPWIVGVFALVCTAVAAVTVWRLSRRQYAAEQSAAENERLYSDQRSVAQTLQHSLLPQTLPEVPGLEFGAVYAPGTDGIDIGGDWYEVVARPDGSMLVVVGDVSGHGLAAATTMASLRFAIRAYAVQGDGPAQILRKLAGLLSISRDGHFATVLCGVLEHTTRTATWAVAGHPRPVLLTGGRTEFVPMPVGPPVGVWPDFAYAEITHTLPVTGTLLLYTDGLVERRGESIDVGFDRLADAVRATAADPLADGLFALVRRVIPDGCDDDAAILGIRWTHPAPDGPATFPGVPASVTHARRYVVDELAGVEPEVVQVAALLVSELATNSVHHASAGFTVAVERTPGRIRVAVSDAGPGTPLPRAPGPVETSGRGLQIVDALADDWGHVAAPDGVGKTVWFEVAAVAEPVGR